jgi:hypothetical protein
MRRVPRRRAMERARFIAESAADEGVHIAILSNPRGPCVFAWAPTAASSERQLACERSFKRAVYQNIRAVSLYAAKPRGRA